ncbi:hypothetical protein B0H13DRAFT_1935799 [Mycena leptocephala]|nr:hypothetical protein B0H13DRAFT_1935799 [Mycena leptocephala]
MNPEELERNGNTEKTSETREAYDCDRELEEKRTCRSDSPQEAPAKTETRQTKNLTLKMSSGEAEKRDREEVTERQTAGNLKIRNRPSQVECAEDEDCKESNLMIENRAFETSERIQVVEVYELKNPVEIGLEVDDQCSATLIRSKYGWFSIPIPFEVVLRDQCQCQCHWPPPMTTVNLKTQSIPRTKQGGDLKRGGDPEVDAL